MQVTNIIKHQNHFTTPLLKALILKNCSKLGDEAEVYFYFLHYKCWEALANGRVRQVTSHHSSRHQLNAQDAKHFSDKAWVHGKSCRQPLGVPG